MDKKIDNQLSLPRSNREHRSLSDVAAEIEWRHLYMMGHAQSLFEHRDRNMRQPAPPYNPVLADVLRRQYPVTDEDRNMRPYERLLARLAKAKITF